MRWLLEVVIDGRTYRWSTEPVDVDDDRYMGGLQDPGEVEDGSTQLALVLTDASVDWPAVAPSVQGSAAVLRRWREDTVLEASVVVLSGEVVSIDWATASDPVRLLVSSAAAAVMGVPFPPPLARSGSLTWPLAGVVGDEGVCYPVLFGYPGYEGSTPYPVVPVALAQYTGVRATTRLIVSEDADAPITSVRIRNDAVGVEANQNAERVNDRLGQRVLVTNFSAAATGYPAAANDARLFYAGFGPAGGGGVARSAYDVLVYLLRRWGSGTVDWGRIPEIEGLIGAYLVDSWVDTSIADPWEWLEQVLLPDLPVAVRVNGNGRRYLVPRILRPLDAQVVAELTAGRHVEAASRVTLERPGPTNEFVAEYREDRTGVYRARVVITGGSGTDLGVLPGSNPGSTDTQSVTVVRSGRCSASLAQYDRRRDRQVQIIDWTWDEGTVLRVLEDRVEREALPARRVAYTIRERLRDQLREADVVRITDEDLGFDGVLASIDEPPRVGAETTRITLRIPQ